MQKAGCFHLKSFFFANYTEISSVLEYKYNGHTACRISFDFNNNSKPIKNSILKYVIQLKRKFLHENFIFYLGKLCQKFFLF